MMVMIFYMSSQDGTESGNLSNWLLNTAFGQILMKILPSLTESGDSLDLRKYAHMAEYAMLAASLLFFFRELLLEKLPLRAAGCAALVSFVYACTDEFHQTFVAGRAGQFTDVLIDMTGALIALALIFLVCYLLERMQNE